MYVKRSPGETRLRVGAAQNGPAPEHADSALAASGMASYKELEL